MSLTCQKHLFNLEDDICYLNGAYMSPLLKKVEGAGIEGILKKRNPGAFTTEDFFLPQLELKARFAKLIGAEEPGRIAIVPSVSYGLANVTKNLRVSKGQKIVLAGDQFPSNYYPWRKLADRKQLELSIITPSNSERDRGRVWNELLIQAIDENTAVLSISHVHWADGSLFDLVELRKRLDKIGGLLIVDGTQSLGALPFDQSLIRADAIICAGYKWLMGPYSIGLAYMGSYFDHGQPIEESWINRVKSDDFANLIDYQHEYRAYAKRYDIGESSNFILTPMMSEGIQQLIEWRPERYQQYCEDITSSATERLKDNGFWIDDINYRSSHLFGIRFSHAVDMNHVKTILDAAKIKVSIRGDAIRVSPGVYNTSDDLNKLTHVLTSEFT